MNAQGKIEPARIAQSHRDRILADAHQMGLLAGPRSAVGVRASRPLLEAAKNRSGLASTTAVIEYALAKVAVEDRFIETALALAGSVPDDVDLEF